MANEKTQAKVLRVRRSKAEAEASYDRLSSFYDLLSGGFENRHKEKALELLDIQRGESVLEIGCGTGFCLVKIAEEAGSSGSIHGIDISSGMLMKAQQRILRAGPVRQIELKRCDAAQLPYEDHQFNVLFSSFCLELFDTPEIPAVLAEMKRVIKPGGRLGILSMSKEAESSLMVKIYEWSHTHFPKFADCRPIFVAESIRDAGFTIIFEERMDVAGLPARFVIGRKE